MTAVFVTLVATAGCSTRSAAAALRNADQAVESAWPEADRYVPEQLKALAEAARMAHDSFDRGDYAGAKAMAESVAADAQAVTKAAGARKQELTETWSHMQSTVPVMIERIKAKMTELATVKTLPNDFEGRLDVLRAEGAMLEQAWSEAQAAFQTGGLVQAVDGAKTARGRADQLMASLGLVTFPPAAPAPPRGASPTAPK